MSIDDRNTPMQELRLKMLTTDPKEFGITQSPNFEKVYGVLMDWPLGEQIISVVSLIDGNASVYSTSTFGVIGGFAHESVKIAAKEFVICASVFLSKSIKCYDLNYPKLDNVRFYFLTFDGLMQIDINSLEITKQNNEYFSLFSKGQSVITELRKITEDNIGDKKNEQKDIWEEEPGYINCLLTLMSEGFFHDAVITHKKPVMNLLEITKENPDSHDWVKEQEFNYSRLDTKKIIQIIMETMNIKGLLFSTRSGYMQTIHARHDGQNIARVFDVVIGPFNKYAHITMAADTDQRVIDLQRTSDKNRSS